MCVAALAAPYATPVKAEAPPSAVVYAVPEFVWEMSGYSRDFRGAAGQTVYAKARRLAKLAAVDNLVPRRPG